MIKHVDTGELLQALDWALSFHLGEDFTLVAKEMAPFHQIAAINNLNNQRDGVRIGIGSKPALLITMHDGSQFELTVKCTQLAEIEEDVDEDEVRNDSVGDLVERERFGSDHGFDTPLDEPYFPEG